MLVAAEVRDGATGSGVVAGFRQLDWAVQLVDRAEFHGATKTLALRVTSRLSKNSLERAYRETILRECNSLHPDVLFTVKGSGLNVELLRRVRDLGAKAVMYYPDFHFDHVGIDQESFKYYDLFVTTKSFQMEWLRRHLGSERVVYVPHGFTEAVFQPVYSALSDEDYSFDVLYVGNHSPYKQQWLERLLELIPSLSLGVVGNRWREQRPRLKIPSSSMLGEVRGLGLAKLIQSSRINIAFHMGKNHSGWEDLVSTRTFEIPACKGFMLHIDNREIREFFDVGKEIDVFSSPEELVEKIRFYLARPCLRSEMIERAFARGVPAYGYVRRAAQIDQHLRLANCIKAKLL